METPKSSLYNKIKNFVNKARRPYHPQTITLNVEEADMISKLRELKRNPRVTYTAVFKDGKAALRIADHYIAAAGIINETFLISMSEGANEEFQNHLNNYDMVKIMRLAQMLNDYQEIHQLINEVK